MKRSMNGLLETQTCKDVKSMYYNEEYALNTLIKNIDIAVARQNAAFDNHTFKEYDQIIIEVNGVKHAFLLGGPQINALYSFINQVADENGCYLTGGDK